ncbi:MAG: hypothetical protein SGJ09_02065 [Phycisphaerae bacterium]|nr:hypothetical protein [Phycisphaerae bacterium]
MLRFLRQYNKIFLGVFGLLLLLAWAIGGSLSQISNYSATEGSTWATWGPTNKKVTIGDLERVRLELKVMDELTKLFPRVPFVPVPGADRDPAYWYLLTKEAEEAGLVGGEQDAMPLLENMAKGINAQLQREGLEMNGETAAAFIAAQSGTNPLIVRQTLAKVNGISRMSELMRSMSHYSDTRLRHAAAEALLGVSADIVVLDARKLAQPAVDEPSEERLAEQLKKYGEFEPGKGEKGFGYRLPNRVKLEWIQIAEAPVRASVMQSGALDTLTLKRKFAANPTRYGVPPEAVGTDPLAVFPQYEATARQKVINELVEERMREIVKFASDQFTQSQRGLKRDAVGLYALPADWASRKPDLKQLAAAIGEKFNVSSPAYGSVGDVWMSEGDLKSLPGLGGTSTTSLGDRPIPFSQLLPRLKEFAKADATNADAVPLVQTDVATPALTASNKDVFFVRFLATEPSRAPGSVDEARQALLADVRAIDRYEALNKLAGELKTQAETDGLREIANRFGTTVEAVPDLRAANPQFIGMGVKFPTSLPMLGADSDALEAVIQRAAGLPKTTPVADVPAAERTYVIPLDKRLAYLLARVTDVSPLTNEEYQTLAGNPRAQMALAGDGLQAAYNDVFSLDALKKRYNFKPVRGDSDDDADGASPDTTPATTANTDKPATAG